MKLSDFHYNSPLGTDFILRPFFDATNAFAGHDYLLAQIYGGSYQSSAANPLFAVQVAMIPIDANLQCPAEAALDFAQVLPKALSAHAAQCAPTKGGVLGDLDLKDYSPKPDNDVTTHTTGWGLEVGAELGKDPHVGVAASFNKQVTWNISDMQVFNRTFQSPMTKSAGILWDLLFTKKDGMNRSPLAPRLDALFACSKTKLRHGRFNFLLTEKYLYWGKWAEHIDLTVGDGSGIGAGVGAVLGFGVLSIPFAAFGAMIGAAIGGAAGLPQAKVDHNDILAKANDGDPTAISLMLNAASQEGKAKSSAALFSLDFDAGMVTELGVYTP